LARLRPLPFREVKRRLELAGFVEESQKGSHVKFVRRLGRIVDTAHEHRTEDLGADQMQNGIPLQGGGHGRRRESGQLLGQRPADVTRG